MIETPLAAVMYRGLEDPQSWGALFHPCRRGFDTLAASRSLSRSLRSRGTMPVIQCDIREGRTEEQKHALAREITRVVHETSDAPLEYIDVLIRETPGSHHVEAGKALPDWKPSGFWGTRFPKSAPRRTVTGRKKTYVVVH
ncbi:MAG: tautomerase family protein [Acidobacteriota bacterium]